jgi:hypothetical protein
VDYPFVDLDKAAIMATRSRQILVQMMVVLTVAVAAAILLFIWKIDEVAGILLGDPRPVILNGGILLLFTLGTWRLVVGIRRYERQEIRIADFLHRRAEGYPCSEILAEDDGTSLLAERYRTIGELFQRGSPIDHGAISAIMVAEESMHQSLPRFVNNVLILTGVFGTVSSLIFALVGASDVLQAAVPDAGMGLLLLGMNTALTTTATAIVCYFVFTFFFHRFTDLQTWVTSQVERIVLIHMLPDFTFETDALNHQTKMLVEDIRGLVEEMRSGLGGIDGAITRLEEASRDRLAQGEVLIAGQAAQGGRTDEALARLTELRRVLVEGFRLER